MNQSRYLPKFHIFNNKLNNLGFYEGGPYGSGMAPKIKKKIFIYYI